MNDRETIRLLAYGQYAFTHREGSIDIADMESFVNGALWVHDHTIKKQVDYKYINAMQIGQEMQEKHIPVDVDSMV